MASDYIPPDQQKNVVFFVPGALSMVLFVVLASSACTRALGLEQVHLLGQSWGTMLATDYMLAKATGVESLVFASPCLGMPRMMPEMQRLLEALLPEVQAIIQQHEAAGTTDSEEYQ